MHHLKAKAYLFALCSVFLLSFTLVAQVGSEPLAPAERTVIQDVYQGLLEGVVPVRLTFIRNTNVAYYQYSSATSKVRLIGTCEAGSCTYRGVDTSMTLTFQQPSLGSAEHKIVGELRLDDGSLHQFQMESSPADVPFASKCGAQLWMKEWKNKNSEYSLTLAALPDNQVKGSLYVLELGTTLRIAGQKSEDQLKIDLLTMNGQPVGEASATFASDLESLTLVLQLDQTPVEIDMHLSQEVPLGCLQAGGRYDLIYPIASQNSEIAQTEFVSNWWHPLVKNRQRYGHAWFEPSQITSEYISGWMHVSTPQQHQSEAITLSRKNAKQLNPSIVLGSKKRREKISEEALEKVIDNHPLRADPSFMTWASTQTLDQLAVIKEGLVLTSKMSPVYGQLVWITPWSDLENKKTLPHWLSAK